MLKTVDDWKIALDKDKIVGAVLIDLSKVFDTIDHNLLLKKLDAYGVEWEEWAWFADYMSDRKQRVSLDGEVSEWSDIRRGINSRTALV